MVMKKPKNYVPSTPDTTTTFGPYKAHEGQEVTKTIDGKTIKFTGQEWKDYLGRQTGRGGASSAAVSELEGINQEKELARIKEAAIQKQIEANQLADEVKNRMAPPVTEEQQNAVVPVGGMDFTPPPTSNIEVSGLRDVLPELGIGGGIAGGSAAAAGGTAAVLGASTVATGGIAAIAAAAVVAASAGKIVTSLKEERTAQILVQQRELKDSVMNIKALITYAKTGDPLEARELYDREWDIIWQTESNLHSLEEHLWTKKAKIGLTDIERLRRIKFIIDTQFNAAILKNTDANYEFPMEAMPTEIE